MAARKRVVAPGTAGVAVSASSTATEVRPILPIGHIGISCNKGRHRSVMLAEWASQYVEELGYITATRLHHLRVGPHDDRGRCGCHEQNCKVAREVEWELDSWHAA
eukprot:15633833-Heterocapsa_arctica.AAC.1